MTSEILEKVRALLAHGETPNISSEEADSYITKAQALMMKYSLDELLVRDRPTDNIVTVEWFIPQPYANAKAQGYYQIVTLFDCRMVQSGRLSIKYNQPGLAVWTTGYESDISQLVMLLASLSIQCTNAMLNTPVTGEAKSFRVGFIQGYFTHIQAVLREQRTRTQKEVDPTGNLLPILRDRKVAVDDAFRDRWPSLGHARIGAGSSAGFGAGHAAARSADINGPKLTSQRALGRGN